MAFTGRKVEREGREGREFSWGSHVSALPDRLLIAYRSSLEIKKG